MDSNCWITNVWDVLMDVYLVWMDNALPVVSNLLLHKQGQALHAHRNAYHLVQHAREQHAPAVRQDSNCKAENVFLIWHATQLVVSVHLGLSRILAIIMNVQHALPTVLHAVLLLLLAVVSALMVIILIRLQLLFVKHARQDARLAMIVLPVKHVRSGMLNK